MSRFLLSLPDELHDALRLSAAMRKQSMSDIVRAAVRAEVSRISQEARRRGAPDHPTEVFTVETTHVR